MIDSEIRYCASKGDEIPGHETPIRDDLPCCRWLGFGLVDEVLASTANGNDERNQVGNPLPSLPDMDHSIPKQSSHKADGAGYADAYVDAEVDTRIDCSDRLTTDDGSDETETGQGCGIQENGNGHEVQPSVHG